LGRRRAHGTILVVDDESELLTIARDMLETSALRSIVLIFGFVHAWPYTWTICSPSANAMG